MRKSVSSSLISLPVDVAYIESVYTGWQRRKRVASTCQKGDWPQLITGWVRICLSGYSEHIHIMRSDFSVGPIHEIDTTKESIIGPEDRTHCVRIKIVTDLPGVTKRFVA